MKDPITAEVRRARRNLAAMFDYDIERLTEHLRHQWCDWPAGHVSFNPEDPKPLRLPKTKRTVSELIRNHAHE